MRFISLGTTMSKDNYIVDVDELPDGMNGNL